MRFVPTALRTSAACAVAALLIGCGGSSALAPGVTSARPQAAPPTTRHAITHVIYKFTGGADGAWPFGGLLYSNGQFYGTTDGGGSGPSGGLGTVFSISPAGTKTTLYRFQGGSDAAAPEAATLVAGPGGVLYGTSNYGGGAGSCIYDGGCGTVYALVPAGSGSSEHVVYGFQGGSDGAIPVGGVLLDTSGALYGTTAEGGGSPACVNGSGTTGCGTVYKLTPTVSGFSESVIHSFQGGSDGIGPRGVLVADGSGALYGTTYYGGGAGACTSPSGNAGCGTVFKLTPSGSGYSESIIYSFQGGTDGAYPRAGLLAGSGGAFFGATTHGGAHGIGTIYELTPSGSGYSERVIHSFGGADGQAPSDENGLYADANGSIYGTTAFGGKVGHGNACNCGTVFKLSPSGSGYTLTTLYRFKGSRVHDGKTPRASLAADASGTLYGSTYGGGLIKGYGTIFKITP